MTEIVFPENNEKDFIEIAEKLGINELLFVYKNKKDVSGLQKNTKIKLSSISASKVIDFSAEKRNFENLKEVIVFNLEIQEKDLMKERVSGLNEVGAKIALENNITIGFSSSSILNTRNKSQIIGRMAQNAMLCRKYKLNTAFASFARNPWNLRAEKDLEGVKKLIGL